jgi:hypothetical protein
MTHPQMNRGLASSLIIKNRYDLETESESDGLIKFDLFSIPHDSDIISARLYLYYGDWAQSDPAGREIALHRVKEAWRESDVTWETRPFWHQYETSSALVPVSAGQWMSWDVTDDVQDFINGKNVNYGWVMIDPTYWGESDTPVTLFYSKERRNYTPYLIVEYQCSDVSVELYPPTTPIPYGGLFAINGILVNCTAETRTVETQDVITATCGQEFDLGGGEVHTLGPNECVVFSVTSELPPETKVGSYTYRIDVYEDDVLIATDSKEFVVDAGCDRF